MLRFILKVRELAFTNVQKDPWNQDTSYMARIISCFEEVGWMKHFGFFRIESRKPQIVNSGEDFVARTHDWGDANLYLLNQGELSWLAEKQLISVSFYPLYQALDLTINFNSAFVQEYSETLLMKASEFVCCLCDKFSKDGVVGPEVKLTLALKTYPRLWPPRQHMHLNFGNLIDFFSYQYFQQEHGDRLAQSLFNTPVPEKIESWRCNDDDLLVIRWVEDLQDEKHILERRALQEKWIIDVVNPPIDSAFLDLLNNEVENTDPYLSYYQKLGYNNGYKKIEVMPNGSFDVDTVTRLVEWKKAKQMPDGRKLKGIFLIVQNLEAALQIYDQVLAMGIDDVFYIC